MIVIADGKGSTENYRIGLVTNKFMGLQNYQINPSATLYQND